MRKFYVMAAMAVLLIGTSSCSNNDEAEISGQNESPVSLQVSNVGLATPTRSGITAASFANGAKLGLYIYRGSGIDDANKSYNDASSSLPTVNVPYGLSGGTWSAERSIVLSNVAGKVYSYYPYAEGNDSQDGTAIPVTVNATQGTGQSDGTKDVTEQSDYMYSTVVADVSNKQPKVSLVMNHALAMVSFKFVQTTEEGVQYPGAGKVSSIVLKNKAGKSAVKTGNATMNIATGVITGGTAGSVTLTPDATATLMDVTDAAKLPRLLVYPVAALAVDDAEVTVTVDGSNYTIVLPALQKGYEAGKNYLYTFTLKGSGLTVENVTITQWTETEGGSGYIQTPDEAGV